MTAVEVQSLDVLDAPDITSPINIIALPSRISYTLSNRRFICVSSQLANALDTEPDVGEIELMCSDDLMKMVVAYMELCKGTDLTEIPKPLSSAIMGEVMCKYPFDTQPPYHHLPFADFIDRIGDTDKQQLYDLVMVANKLGIKGLLHLGLAKTCTFIKGYPIGDLKHRLLPNGPDGRPLKEFRPHFHMGLPPKSEPLTDTDLSMKDGDVSDELVVPDLEDDNVLPDMQNHDTDDNTAAP